MSLISGFFSAREEEIFQHLSEGKTNTEIAEILTISSFMVKNHVQRTMKKLDAATRTEAVAKYRQMRLTAQGREAARESAWPRGRGAGEMLRGSGRCIVYRSCLEYANAPFLHQC